MSYAIEVSGLTKRFGDTLPVDHPSLTVAAGRIVGFLGPNGAGKTTTLCALLGLVRPTAGAATIEGRAYAQLDDPARTAGAVLDGGMLHPGRTGRNHLRALACAAGVPRSRVEELLRLVGLQHAADRRAGHYSLGMRQRLGLAGALLGDPRVLILDEPANGLDPEGIRWLRGFFRHLAGEGRTVLVSSHQLAEVQEFADRAVILNRGKLVRAGTMAELSAGHTSAVVRGPDLAGLQRALVTAGLSGSTEPDGSLRVGTDDLRLI